MSAPLGYQSLLFVPGSRPDRFDKALSSGADLVVIDLEDAVGPADKDAARIAAIAAIGHSRLGIRVNGLRTKHGLADLLALSGTVVPYIMLPMVEAATEIEIVHAILGAAVGIIPLVETVRGLAAAPAIAAAPGIAGGDARGRGFCRRARCRYVLGRALRCSQFDRHGLRRCARPFDRRSMARP